MFDFIVPRTRMLHLSLPSSISLLIAEGERNRYRVLLETFVEIIDVSSICFNHCLACKQKLRRTTKANCKGKLEANWSGILSKTCASPETTFDK